LLIILYSGDEIPMNKWAGYMARSRESRGLYRVLVGRTEGKRTLGRTRRRKRIILKCIFKKCDGEG
jgi:hypothetical protein